MSPTAPTPPEPAEPAAPVAAPHQTVAPAARWPRCAGSVARGFGLTLAAVLLLFLIWLLYDNATAPNQSDLPVTVVALAEQPLGPPPAPVKPEASPAPARPAASAAPATPVPTRQAAASARPSRINGTGHAVSRTGAKTAATRSARHAAPARRTPPRVLRVTLSAAERDVALLAAVLAHANNVAVPQAAAPPADAADAHHAVALRRNDEATGALLQRCRQLGVVNGRLCPARGCAGHHGRASGCR